jgi:hypothetical protein
MSLKCLSHGGTSGFICWCQTCSGVQAQETSGRVTMRENNSRLTRRVTEGFYCRSLEKAPLKICFSAQHTATTCSEHVDMKILWLQNRNVTQNWLKLQNSSVAKTNPTKYFKDLQINSICKRRTKATDHLSVYFKVLGATVQRHIFLRKYIHSRHKLCF